MRQGPAGQWLRKVGVGMIGEYFGMWMGEILNETKETEEDFVIIFEWEDRGENQRRLQCQRKNLV